MTNSYVHQPLVAELASLPLIADVQYLEPYTSTALNRKFFGVIPKGIYRGFDVEPSGSNTLIVKAGGSAAIEKDTYLITVHGQHDISLDIPHDISVYIVLDAEYEHGTVTKQVDNSSLVDAATISVIAEADLQPHHVVVCGVYLPSGETLSGEHIETEVRTNGAFGDYYRKAETQALFVGRSEKASDTEIDTQSDSDHYVSLPQLWRAFDNFMNSIANGVRDKGSWDASSGSFPISPDAPETSDMYRISVAGTLSDSSNPNQEDLIVEAGDNIYWSIDSDVWYMIDNTERVTSVQGRRGAVVLTKSDVDLDQVPNLPLSNAYKTTGEAFASQQALYDAYSELNSSKLGANANAVSASVLAVARLLSLSGDATGSVSFDGSGDVTLSVTVKDDSHAHIISNVDGLQTALDSKLDKTGTAPLADALATARTITLGGDASGSVSFDGSGNVTLTVTVKDDSHAHTIANIDDLQDALDAKLGTSETAAKALLLATARTIALTGDVTGSASFNGGSNVSIAAVVADDSHAHTIANVTGLQTALDAKLASTGTAKLASALAVARTISLSGDATGSVSFDGSGNVTMTVTVADNSHAHTIANVTGLQTALNAKLSTSGTAADSELLDGIDSTGFMRAQSANGYYGLGAAGNFTNWIRTTVNGIIPYQSGGASALGTSSWQFNTAHIKTIYENGTSLAAKYLGIAATAAKASVLATARTISLSGDLSGSASFDGSASITISATVADNSHAHTIANVTGLQTALDAKLSTSGKAADSQLLDGIDSTSFLRSDAKDYKTAGAQVFNDNVILAIGSGEDVEHFWNGTNYYTDINEGGNWYVRDGDSSNATRFTFAVGSGDFMATGQISSYTLKLSNIEKSNMSTDGQVGFDSSQGLIVYRTQQGVSGAAVTVLDGANVKAGDGISISNLLAGGTGTDTFTFAIDDTVVRTTGVQAIDGTITANEFIANSSSGFRIANGNYGFFLRNDGANTYFLLTASGDNEGSWNSLRPMTINNASGKVTMGNGLAVSNGISGDLAGNASTATKLETARTINGTSFNGTAAITTVNWGTSRNITIGSSTKAVNGSAAVSWSLDDIGAMASNAATKFNVGRGDVYVENNSSDNDSGAGITLRASSNPASGNDGDVGSIFAVRSSGNALRFWVGQSVTSTGDNSFKTKSITALGDVTSSGEVYANSDARLKTNVTPIESALEKVLSLSGYTYDKKRSLHETETTRETGVIAQEVLKVLPEAVRVDENDDDGIMSVAYGNMVGLLIEAMKQQQSQIESLEQRLTELTNK